MKWFSTLYLHIIVSSRSFLRSWRSAIYLRMFPSVWNTNLWSPYAKEPDIGPCSEPEKPNPNLYFCKIRGIIICDNATLINFIKIAFKNSVSISQKTPSLHYKVDQITASWRSKYIYFEGDKHINTLYGKDALSPKLNSAQIRDNQAPGILIYR